MPVEERLKKAPPRYPLPGDSVSCPPRITVSLLGRWISFMTIPTILKEIHQSCRQHKRLLIASCNVYSFNLSLHMPWFYHFMHSADIVRCDGLGIIKAIGCFGLDIPIEYRASGTELVPKLIGYGAEQALSFFLLGSKPEHVRCALNHLAEKYPNLRVEGHHGYFDKEDPIQNASVIKQINQFNPDILIVGMGMPVQEKWVCQNMDRLDARVIIPCGAVIDRLAGVVSDCPTPISNAGLEWLYRLVKEPKRLAKRYLIGNLAFACNLILATAYSKPLQVSKSALKKLELANARQFDVL